MLEAAEPVQRPSPEIEQACYRIAEEALSNALTHAGAATVAVHVEEVGGGLQMEVRDDGRGFDAASVTGPGLVEMRERARGIDARFSVTSAPGRGTCVRVHVPRAGTRNTEPGGAVQ